MWYKFSYRQLGLAKGVVWWLSKWLKRRHHCNSEGFLSKRKVTSSFQRMIQRRNIVDVLIKCPTPECACCFSEVLIQLSDGTEIKGHSRIRIHSKTQKIRCNAFNFYLFKGNISSIGRASVSSLL